MSRFLGVTRERVFSPGRVDDDRAVLEHVAECLRDSGHAVTVVDADEPSWSEPDRDTPVFAMCQGPAALARLQQWQTRGVRVVNTPQGVLNCQRHRTLAALEGAPVAFPETVLVNTTIAVKAPAWFAAAGAWIKRGDVHATEADDVVFVDHDGKLDDVLARFRRRGITQAIVQRHVPGTVVKFYAVRGQFFHCVIPPDYECDAQLLARIDAIGRAAARRLDVEVYGGDCVCDSTGEPVLIDLNDWPSYARCRARAARAIAAYLDALTVTTAT